MTFRVITRLHPQLIEAWGITRSKLNPALALYVGEAVTDNGDFFHTFSQAVILAQDVIQSGEAWNKLEQLAQFLL